MATDKNILPLWQRVLLTLSAAAFFCQTRVPRDIMIFSMSTAVVFIWVVLGYVDRKYIIPPATNRLMVVLPVLPAFGISFHVYRMYFDFYDAEPSRLIVAGSIFLVLGLPAVYLWCRVAWFGVADALRRAGIFQISKKEASIYASVFLMGVAAIIAAYSVTSAFGGTSDGVTTLYTLDSLYSSEGSIFVNLVHIENDIRQPLFMPFSGPFAGWAYPIAVMSPAVGAVCLQLSQFAMMFMGDILIASAVTEDSRKRVMFVLLMRCSQAGILYMLAMEQYQSVYFWLAVCVCLASRNEEIGPFEVCGMTGTLVSGAAILPLLEKGDSFAEKIGKCVIHGCAFIAAIILACRFELLWSISTRIQRLLKFTGIGISMNERISQYLASIPDVFVMPAGGITVAKEGILATQAGGLLDASGQPVWAVFAGRERGVFGIVILVLCAVAFLICRKRRVAVISAGWIGVWVLCLVIVGWGTFEDQLILYCLYFGWACMALLFMLTEQICEWLKKPRATLVIAAVGAVGMLCVNIPGFIDMIKAFEIYYPA